MNSIYRHFRLVAKRLKGAYFSPMHEEWSDVQMLTSILFKGYLYEAAEDKNENPRRPNEATTHPLSCILPNYI